MTECSPVTHPRAGTHLSIPTRPPSTVTRLTTCTDTHLYRPAHLDRPAHPPVVVNLVDDEDLVADLLLVEERVHEGNKHQQLIEALSEGDDQGQLVRTP